MPKKKTVSYPKTKKKKKKFNKKVEVVMEEFKKGELNIGKSKKKVKNRRQAIAIALNEAAEKVKKKK